MIFRLHFLLATCLLAGCAAQTPPQPSYAEQIAQLPQPKDSEERQRACSYIRSEIARMQNIAMVGSAQLQPTYALGIQIGARNNIAALESKAAEFRCTAAFAERQAPSSIESCVATCKANTTRSAEQCFDSCNR
jgi:hypothetical protein